MQMLLSTTHILPRCSRPQLDLVGGPIETTETVNPVALRLTQPDTIVVPHILCLLYC